MPGPGPKPKVDEKGVPYLYTRALLIFDYMMENASYSPFEADYHIYEGSITDELKAEYDITLSQYSRAANLLKDVGAIERLEKSPLGSRWRVNKHRPTLQELEAAKIENSKTLKRPAKIDMLDQRIRDIVSILSAHEDRLKALETVLNPEPEEEEKEEEEES